MPFRRDPNIKINVFKLAKDLIGKDVTKITLPVYLNMPLSLLQHISAFLEPIERLKQASIDKDPLQRALQVTLLVFERFVIASKQQRKGFNPILGETFEYVH